MLDNNEDCEVAKYFINLGYKYSWDCDRKYTWHEIIHPNGKLIIQVEMVPLEKIIDDICVIEEIEPDYFLAASLDTNDLYMELCDKVREFEKAKK